MGLGNNPVPSSPSSACSEANGKSIPQVYKGHGKKENVDGAELLWTQIRFWLVVEPMASRYGLQMLLTKLSFLQQKSNMTNMKLSFVNNIWSPYLDAIGSTASQNYGMWMRLDTINLEYMFYLITNKLSAFLLLNVHSAIAGSTNHKL
ncbi:hypothetical protein V6N13_122078 [Hibiscus sabdariffa]